MLWITVLYIAPVPAVKTHTEELRAALIDEAGRVLRTEGPGAVALRRLARATGTSTAAVYTLFGDKAGLIDQMYIEGFRRLTHTVAASPATADPVQDLLAMGGAYRGSSRLRAPSQSRGAHFSRCSSPSPAVSKRERSGPTRTLRTWPTTCGRSRTDSSPSRSTAHCLSSGPSSRDATHPPSRPASPRIWPP